MAAARSAGGCARADRLESRDRTWDLQGQVVVLSAPGTSPRLEEGHLDVGTDPRLLADLQARGATGLLLPGVDGDVAGLYTFERADMQALKGALAAAARDAGGLWLSVAETELRRLL